VETQHLLYLDVQNFDFFIFSIKVAFKIALICHDLLHVETTSLNLLVMGYMSKRSLGSMALDFFLPLGNNSLQLFLNILMR
jgi:hypothetical protein